MSVSVVVRVIKPSQAKPRRPQALPALLSPLGKHRRANTDTLVFSERTPTGRAVSLWDELRTWDPGD